MNSVLATMQVTAACFMAWKAVSLWADTPCPIMVVTTESMAPAFAPGDVLLVATHQRHVHVGDLPVCRFPDSAVPMVHRVIRVMGQGDRGDRGRGYVCCPRMAPVSCGS